MLRMFKVIEDTAVYVAEYFDDSDAESAKLALDGQFHSVRATPLTPCATMEGERWLKF
jgi:hypothetical protein